MERSLKKANFTETSAATYEMESQVNYWSDYLKPKLHDRSYNSINRYQTSCK